MAQTYTCHAREYFWGETFYTDRHFSAIAASSMPEMVEDHSEDSEESVDGDYHLSSAKLFETHHDKSPRAVSTLLTQVNRTYAMENHHYPNFLSTPSRPARCRSARREYNVLQTIESTSKLDVLRPANRSYNMWPLCTGSNQLAHNRPSIPHQPSLRHSNTTPKASNTQLLLLEQTCSPTSSPNARNNSPTTSTVGLVDHERSYFEYSDDEGSDNEDGVSGSLTEKAMRRLHIRTPSASKIGDITTGSLRRLFRSSKKL